MKPEAQLFIVGHDVWAACSDEEIMATAAGLQEFGIFKLPYERVSLRMLLDDSGVMSNEANKDPAVFTTANRGQVMVVRGKDGKIHPQFGPHHYIEIRNINQLGEPIEVIFIHEGGDSRFKRYELDDTARRPAKDLEFIRENVVRFLIVLLATRNIVKTVRENKLAKLGIGKKARRYAYTTTISLPAPETLEADTDHPPTGRTVIPHYRRGYSRNVVYGPGRAFRRLQWIAPVFVNADKEWVATRTAYNIGGKA